MRSGKNSRLLAEQRRRKIMDMIEEKGQVTVGDLVEKFSISAVTVRADLDVLSSQGMAVRSHGGAVRQVESSQEYPLRLKKTLHHAEKVRIGRAAAELIQDNETVILDSGTTTVEIARQLKARRLQSVTVITHSLNVACELMDAGGISLIMIGGVLRPISCSFVGPQAEGMVREFHADRLFLGVDGFDLEIGASTPDVLEAQLNGLMMRISKEVNVVADFSKLGRRSVSRIGSISGVHRLITDTKVPAEFSEALRKAKIDLITA
jgi:DeoR family transcriptional regulator, aga operon transcriptional repressor